MNPPPIRLAMVGCGQIARHVHLPVLRHLPGVRVTVVADPDPVRRADAARLVPGATPVASVEEAVAHDVDAVAVAVPTGQHAAAALTVLRAGKHLYLEKPLATHPAEAEPVLAAWRRAGVVGMIGFNYRFNPLFVKLRRLIQSGRLGDIRELRSRFTTPTRPLPAWKQTRASGGGVLLDLGSHHFDLLPWLLGRPVEQITAEVRSVNTEADTATVTWRFAGGIRAESFFSLAADRDEDSIEIGPLRVDRYRSGRVARWGGDLPGWYTWQRLRSVGHEPSYTRAWREFLAAIRATRPVSPDLADGCRSLELATRAAGG